MNDQSVAGEVKDKGSEVEPLDVKAVNVGAKAKAQPLYAAREPIFAKRAEGNFRRLKWIIAGIAACMRRTRPS